MSLSRIGANAPLGLIGMLALLAVTEARIDRAVIPDPSTLAWQMTRRAAAHEARECAVLGFGDSLVKLGLIPETLEKALGVRAYNLALPGGSAAAFEALLRRALEHGARPSVVLIDGESLAFPPFQQTRLWIELLPPNELGGLAHAVGDWHAAGTLVLEHLLPSLRWRDLARSQILESLAAGHLRGSIERVSTHARNWRTNRGAQLMPIVPLNPDILRNADGSFFGCHPANLPYVERFLDHAAAAGATVAWLLLPIHPTIQAARDRAGYRETSRQFLEDLQARYPNLVVIDGQSAPMPHEALSDLTHLNRDGASRFTSALVEALRPLLAGGPVASAPRWITLKSYPEAPAVAGEDLFESHRIVLQAREDRYRAMAAAALAQDAQGAGVSR